MEDVYKRQVELMQIVDSVFTRFGIRVCIKINNRKILSGIAEIIGESDKIVDITVAIDKLDKIGLDNVNAELQEKGISDEAIAKLQPIILLSGSNEEKLVTLKQVLANSEIGLKGVEESEFILSTLKNLGLKNELELDLTLARGLNYYTGAIFEVKALDVQIGSITGGGRYDNLTGVFGTMCIRDSLWVKDLNSRVDFVNGFTESYGDPLGMKASWESLVNFKDLDSTHRTELISNNAQWFEDNSPVEKQFKKEKVKGVSAKVITAVILAGDLYPATAIGINLPNANWIRSQHGSKSVTIGNITDAYNKACLLYTSRCV